MRLVAGKASENHPALLWDVRPLWAPQLSPGLWFSSSAVTPIFPVSRGVRVLPCVSELNVVSPITWGKIALQNKCINSYLFSIFFVLEVRSQTTAPGPKPALAHVCTAPERRTVFTFVQDCEKSKEAQERPVWLTEPKLFTLLPLTGKCAAPCSTSVLMYEGRSIVCVFSQNSDI